MLLAEEKPYAYYARSEASERILQAANVRLFFCE